MNWTYFYNPLSKLPSKPALLIGIIITVVGSFISYLMKTIFDGIWDVHSFSNITYGQAISANLINIILPCVLLFSLGRIINPKTRMIDVLNASFLYRIPFYVIPFLINLPIMKSIEAKINGPLTSLKDLQFSTDEIMILLIISCITILIIAYSITLLLFGFKTATNAKKWQHYAAFALVLLICEVTSKLLINSII